jgi:hypothetical protein
MQASRLADRDESRVELERDARREHEATRLDARDLVHPSVAEWIGDRDRRTAQELSVSEQAEGVGVASEVLQPFRELVSHRAEASLCACTTTITSTAWRRIAVR